MRSRYFLNAAGDWQLIESRIVHRHDGGTIHNHERYYQVTQMRAPGAIHSHRWAPDWRPAPITKEG